MRTTRLSRRLSMPELSAQIAELVFLYSNVNNKVLLTRIVDARTTSRPPTTCFSRDVSSARRPTISTSSEASSRASAPRPFLFLRSLAAPASSPSTSWTAFSATSTTRSPSGSSPARSSREFCRKLHEKDLGEPFLFRLNVLTKGIWPSLPESEFEDLDKSAAVRLPEVFQPFVETFNALSVDSERTFRWSFVRGFVKLEMTLHERRVSLQMLPLQAIVLLLFQGDEQLSWEEVRRRVNVNDALLKQVLSSLLFSKFQVGVERE